MQLIQGVVQLLLDFAITVRLQFHDGSHQLVGGRVNLVLLRRCLAHVGEGDVWIELVIVEEQRRVGSCRQEWRREQYVQHCQVVVHVPLGERIISVKVTIQLTLEECHA